jgi:AcrR family transcriptional regulator
MVHHGSTINGSTRRGVNVSGRAELEIAPTASAERGIQRTDRRVQRTHLALREALLVLLCEREWDAIDVQALCQRADIGRSTFYTHFQNKEELLVSGLGDLRDFLWASATHGRVATPDRLWYVRGLIEHAAEQRRLFQAIIGRRSGHVVQQRFREMARALVVADFALRGTASWQDEAAAHHVSGALVDLLGWWVDTTHQVTAAELERYIIRVVQPVLDDRGS